jgi:hypothetical protein
MFESKRINIMNILGYCTTWNFVIHAGNLMLLGEGDQKGYDGLGM